MPNTQDPIDLVLERLEFPYSPALLGLGMSSTVGLLQYIYSVFLVRREGRGPFPLWMHTFYLAHDTTWAYKIAFETETSYPEHWFLQLMPIGLSVWSALEIYCLYKSVTVERAAVFGRYAYFGGKTPTAAQAVGVILLLILAMYAVVLTGLIIMGENCMMEWFALTNILMVIGPTLDWMERGLRRGLSVGLALVSLFGIVSAFSPYGLWVTGLPEVFDCELYYLIGGLFTVVGVVDLAVVLGYPGKTREAWKPAPIW
ncbi:hypothetical protein BDV18DRAFT_163943 [Aspergillus unguis]